jgi:predicted nucleic acid-binding protein
MMEIVIDTSALISVIVGEPERQRIVEVTSGNILIGPGSISCEIGNTFSAMVKQNRLTLKEAKRGCQFLCVSPFGILIQILLEL